MGAATPFIVAGTSVLAAEQAKSVGKYNRDIQNRNATIAEQEAEQIDKQLEFKLARFDESFLRLQGQTKTRILKSGAELSGSGLRILRYNSEQAEIEKNIIEYNSKINKQRKLEEANFSRMQGSLAVMEAKQAALGYYSQAGQSLLTNFGDQ